jgi:hypothetical protein
MSNPLLDKYEELYGKPKKEEENPPLSGVVDIPYDGSNLASYTSYKGYNPLFHPDIYDYSSKLKHRIGPSSYIPTTQDLASENFELFKQLHDLVNRHRAYLDSSTVNDSGREIIIKIRRL